MKLTAAISSIILTAPALALADAGLIINEYNAVSDVNFLTLDPVAPYKGRDSHFGRVQGNGGNWLELAVTTDRLDVRGWSINWSNADLPGTNVGSVSFNNIPIWSSLRAGTIITIREDDLAPPGFGVKLTDTSFNPKKNDWWMHINVDDTNYLDQQGFKTDNDNWQATIKDAHGNVVFGPIGEAVAGWGGGGINSSEIAANIANPSGTNTNSDFDDNDYSTFGAPNRFNSNASEQDFSQLRAWWNAPRTPGDANIDGKVDIADLYILATHWQATGDFSWLDADFTDDNLINAADLAILAAHWQQGAASPVSLSFNAAMLSAGVTPEPATIALLVPLAGAMLRRRRAGR